MQLVCCLQLSLFLSLILKRILNSIVMDVMDMEPYLCEQSNVFCMSCFVFRSPFKIISLQKENIWYFIKSCFFLNVFFFFLVASFPYESVDQPFTTVYNDSKQWAKYPLLPSRLLKDILRDAVRCLLQYGFFHHLFHSFYKRKN